MWKRIRLDHLVRNLVTKPICKRGQYIIFLMYPIFIATMIFYSNQQIAFVWRFAKKSLDLGEQKRNLLDRSRVTITFFFTQNLFFSIVETLAN